MNVDGTVVVGVGQNQAFRWTTATGMAGLGFLAGDNVSVATGVNADGAVVVGHSTDATSGIQQAFRWTVAAGMSLQVSPATGIASSGSQGGPFSPSSFKYTRERQAATFNARSPAFRRGSLPRQLQAL